MLANRLYILVGKIDPIKESKYSLDRYQLRSQDPWEFCVTVMENFIPDSMVWHANTTKHD